MTTRLHCASCLCVYFLRFVTLIVTQELKYYKLVKPIFLGKTLINKMTSKPRPKKNLNEMTREPTALKKKHQNRLNQSKVLR